LQEDLARRGRRQILAADDLAHALGGVVDDNRQLVGVDAVGANHDEIVDHPGHRAEQGVIEVDFLATGPQPQGQRPARVDPRTSLGVAQFAAGTRVGALGEIAVRGGGRLADLRARAKTGVEMPGCAEPRDGIVVERQALGLPDGRPVPLDAESEQIGDLLALPALARPLPIEVLDPQQEPPAM
jgi:hypothetical protein